jgi:uncharacterized Ntn-hydrolase superfamily protein
MTYSILGRDPATGHVGGAVQTAAYSSGSGGVIWVEAGVGAVATQAIGERAFGYLGLQMMVAGSTPIQVVAALVAGDATPSVRQMGVIDCASTPAALTGGDCVPNAEHQVGIDCVAQANMMANPGVPQAMVATFEAAPGDLADRLLAALDSAQALGGDFRGMQSAGLVVRTGERGTPAWKTAVVNVRVDDHPEPLAELRRLAGLTRVYRNFNVPLERLAAGDCSGAVESARELSFRLPDDSNARIRMGLTLAASGDPEGTEILDALAEQSGKWLAYVKGLCLRYHLDPNPILERLRWKGQLT